MVGKTNTSPIATVGIAARRVRTIAAGVSQWFKRADVRTAISRQDISVVAFLPCFEFAISADGRHAALRGDRRTEIFAIHVAIEINIEARTAGGKVTGCGTGVEFRFVGGAGTVARKGAVVAKVRVTTVVREKKYALGIGRSKISARGSRNESNALEVSRRHPAVVKFQRIDRSDRSHRAEGRDL